MLTFPLLFRSFATGKDLRRVFYSCDKRWSVQSRMTQGQHSSKLKETGNWPQTFWMLCRKLRAQMELCKQSPSLWEFCFLRIFSGEKLFCCWNCWKMHVCKPHGNTALKVKNKTCPTWPYPLFRDVLFRNKVSSAPVTDAWRNAQSIFRKYAPCAPGLSITSSEGSVYWEPRSYMELQATSEASS